MVDEELRILAIETAGVGGSVALGIGGVTAERRIEDTREQTSLLLPLIDELLQTAGLDVGGLHAIAFGHGPGSFTGLRVAAAVAQGLALPTGVPIVSVPTMAGLLQGAWREHGATSALVCTDARMDEVYWGHYEIIDRIAVAMRADAISAPAGVIAPDRDGFACLGDGFARYPEELARHRAAAGLVLAERQPLAVDLLPIAADLCRSGSFVAPAAALPTYLRDSTAWRRQ